MSDFRTRFEWRSHGRFTCLAARSCYQVLAVVVAAALAPDVVMAQTALINGRVTTEAGAPLGDATVSIPALGLGARSGEDGQYSFTVPAARVAGQTVDLVSRRVGYTPATVQIKLTAGTITRDIRMTQSALRLGEVVITGAGTSQTRERLGNVINTVDSSTIARAAVPQNIVSALTSTAPNVQVRTEAGDPGGSAFIIIRGATSVTGTNQPLFVIDNQPIDNSTIATSDADASTVTPNRAADINPNDVESVQILKGAAATAIYGARAANGVVLITTKRGRMGPTRYSFSSTETIDRVIKTMPLQTDFGQGSGGVAPTCASFNCALTSLSFGPRLSPATPVFLHGKEIFETGFVADNNLSIAGGNDRTTFFLSGGYTGQDGVMKGANNEYNRTSVRLKASQQLRNAFTLGGNFAYIDTRGAYVQKGSNTSGLLLGALRTPPNYNNVPFLDPVFGLHRSYRFPNPNPASLRTGRGYDNPFFVLNNPGNKSELGRFIGNVSVDWVAQSWLSFNYTIGSDYYDDSRIESLPLTSSGNPEGQVTRFNINWLEFDHNLIATFSHVFSADIDSKLTLGQNLNSRRYRDMRVLGNELIAPTPFALQNTVSYTPTETKSKRHILAYFGQLELGFDDQLFVTGGLRLDGFSTFGSSKRTAWYPKISAAWMFTNYLGSVAKNGYVSAAKLRASYGETGREPPVYGTISALSATALFGSGFGDFIGVKQSSQGGLVSALQLGNDDLKPERDKEGEVGLDLGFLDQRSDFSITLYSKRSTDVILAIPVNASQTGATSQLANAATVTNKGVELSFNVRPISDSTKEWTIGLQYGKNNGKVVSLAQGVEFIPYNTEGFNGAIGSSTVGYAPGVIRGLDFARCGYGQVIVINGVSTDIDAGCGATAPKGALYLTNVGGRGLPVVNPDEGVIANPNPRWLASISSGFRIGQLEFTTLFDFRRGSQLWNGTRGALYRFGTHKDTDIRTDTGTFGVNFETEPYPHVAGPGAGLPAFRTPAEWQAWFTGPGGSAGDAQLQFVENGSFVKWRELSVSYRFDSRALRRTGLTNAVVRLAGRNLATWSDYKGMDPEVNLGGAEFLTQGIDFFNNPATRSFVIGITLNR